MRDKTEKMGPVIARVLSELEKKEGAGTRENPAFPAGTGAWQERPRNLDIESEWVKILDDTLKSHGYVHSLHGGRLLVRVDGSCYLAAFNMQKAHLLKKLHDAGFVNINKLEFRI
jgi:hypothetical protein